MILLTTETIKSKLLVCERFVLYYLDPRKVICINLVLKDHSSINLIPKLINIPLNGFAEMDCNDTHVVVKNDVACHLRC